MAWIWPPTTHPRFPQTRRGTRPRIMHFDFDTARSAKILVTITFHYDENRFPFLAAVLASLAEFPVERLDVILITNTKDTDKFQILADLCHALLRADNKSFTFSGIPELPHPFLLTWCHKSLISGKFFTNPANYTHFIYLEDDMKLSFLNFCYFVTYREILKEHGVLPSFLRMEFSQDLKQYVNTDHAKPMDLTDLARGTVLSQGNRLFVNMSNPYIALFILDTDLAQEYVASRSFSLETSLTVVDYQMRELAAMGLCFEHIPPGFLSRYVVPVSIKTNLPPPVPGCIICQTTMPTHPTLLHWVR